MRNGHIPGSFRDPSGFAFVESGTVYRQINSDYQDHYDQLVGSGLYRALVDAELLIPHAESSLAYAQTDEAWKIIKPEPVDFISYPYEWCFSELKDAALTTLAVQKTALRFGMSLKDCSAYNIQFKNGKPILIDTLSLEPYREGYPWVAYRQFCQHFLAPLALMSHTDCRLNQLSRVYVDGVPLDLASSLLPRGTYLSFSLLSHVHLHARSQKAFAGRTLDTAKHKISKRSLLGLIDNLESFIKGLKYRNKAGTWADYQVSDSYSEIAGQDKEQLVSAFIDRISPRTVWDLGANTGTYSRVVGNKGVKTISFDVDHNCVEANYVLCRRNGDTNVLPLVLDLTNPSPSLGWANQERMSLLERGPADAGIVLALVHHLAIANNLPFGRIAGFLSSACKNLIIEFVPKEDPQTQRLLVSREDIFKEYTKSSFENAFDKFFRVVESRSIRESQRILYLMERR